MGFMDSYKKRLKVDTVNRAIELDTEETLISEFKNSPAYKEAILLDENMDEMPLDIRLVNVDKSVFEKKIYLLPNTELEIGRYIKLQDEYFLIKEFEFNSMSPFAKVRYCNQKIVFVDGSFVPCIAEGESYGVKMVATNDVILDVDTKVKVTVGDIVKTRNIYPDFRMIFGNSRQGIYRVGDSTYYQKGLITFTCKKDKYIQGLDDLENNIAWQPDYDYENQANTNRSIEGAEKMLVGKEHVYVLDTNEICDFAVDNENVEIVTLDMYTITLKCDKPNEIFKLQALINGKVVAEKAIITMN